MVGLTDSRAAGSLGLGSMQQYLLLDLHSSWRDGGRPGGRRELGRCGSYGDTPDRHRSRPSSASERGRCSGYHRCSLELLSSLEWCG